MGIDPVSLWGDLPDWFEEAKAEYPYAVKFEAKTDQTTSEAYRWCLERLGYPTRVTDWDSPPMRPGGRWIIFGFKTQVPQIWFRDEKDASLFRVFFG